jgi:hypothetical protein
MVWNEARTSIGDQWGSGPAMAAGIPASITLRTQATAATVYALDARGQRVKPIPATLTNGQLVFRIAPEHRTLWYEITTTQRQPATPAAKSAATRAAPVVSKPAAGKPIAR